MPEKSIVLTPNKRLARDLQRKFCLNSSQQKQTAWGSAKILPLRSWLTECWQNFHDPKELLSTLQEKLLWQHVIAEKLGEKISSLSDIAIDFHNLINNWQISTDEIFSYQTENNTPFQCIYQQFRTFCKTNNLITHSEISNLIIPYLEKSNFTQVTFAGFDEYSPQTQKLIDTLEKTGCKIIKFDPNDIQVTSIQRLSCDSLKQEIFTAARWAKKITADKTTNSVGIIVPNLISLRSKVAQIFTEVFGDIKKINISAGTPLNSLPIVESAITAFSITANPNLSNLIEILKSPYIKGTETEFYERVSLGAQLKNLSDQQLSLEKIKKYAQQSQKDLTIFIEIIEQYQQLPSSINNQKLSPSEWIKIFIEILQLAGWPGEQSLTELESLALKHLRQVIQDLTTTDLIIGKITHHRMLQILHNTVLYSNTVQPQTKHETQIDIFGTLEASGINFDHLWIIGVDQDNWPAAPKPNPFIPIAIQKKLSLPHSSAERELHFYNNLINRYKKSAKEIIFSFVNQANGQTIDPSFLIKNIPEIALTDLTLEQQASWNEKIFAGKKLEQLSDNLGPQITPNEVEHANSRLVELQSLCPFRAFIEFRLITKEPTLITPAISKIDRGIVLHDTLEIFWKQVKTHQELCQLNQKKLEEMILNSVTIALNKLNPPVTLYQLEKQCLALLLTKWIEVEKNRKPFKVIATERSLKIELASIPIKLRIDRVDQLDNGKQLLIDYKTGKNIPSIFDLFGKRPRSPQLLLYSIALNSIEALALAQININSLRLKEFNLDELIFALHKKDNNNDYPENIDWPTLIEYWRNILTRLITDFSNGQASVTPLSPQVCKQCSFSSICRITF